MSSTTQATHIGIPKQSKNDTVSAFLHANRDRGTSVTLTANGFIVNLYGLPAFFYLRKEKEVVCIKWAFKTPETIAILPDHLKTLTKLKRRVNRVEYEMTPHQAFMRDIDVLRSELMPPEGSSLDTFAAKLRDVLIRALHREHKKGYSICSDYVKNKIISIVHKNIVV